MPPTEALALLAVSLLGLALWRRRRRRHARAERLERWARNHGLTTPRRDDRSLTHRYAGLRLMHAGHHHRVADVMHRATPLGRLVVFTFTCETGFATDRRLIRRSVALLETAADLPGLYFSHREPIEPVGIFQGYRPLRSSPTDSDPGRPCLYVETPLDDALDTDLADCLAAQPPDRTLECRGRFVAAYAPAEDDPDTLTPLLDAVPDLAEQLLR